MEQEDRDYLKSLTQGERLSFLIKRYFKSQNEFANITGISDKLISQYCNNKTIKISKKSLSKIENVVGFNSVFIEKAEGNDLIEGSELKPFFENIILKKIVTETQIKKGEVKQKRVIGETEQLTLFRSGGAMLLSEYGTANIIDIAYNGLEKPILIQVIDSYFCEKYKINIPTNLVIDKNNYEDGNIVFLKYKKEYYLARYEDNKLFEIALGLKNKEIPNDDDTNIIGRMFSLIYYV